MSRILGQFSDRFSSRRATTGLSQRPVSARETGMMSSMKNTSSKEAIATSIVAAPAEKPCCTSMPSLIGAPPTTVGVTAAPRSVATAIRNSSTAEAFTFRKRAQTVSRNMCVTHGMKASAAASKR